MIGGMLQEGFGVGRAPLKLAVELIAIATPGLALLMVFIGGRRREKGKGVRDLTTAVAIVWGTGSLIVLSVWFLQWFVE